MIRGLAPCPTCGRLPSVFRDDFDDTWTVWCQHYDSVRVLFNRKTRQQAIEDWNRLHGEKQQKCKEGGA